MSKTGDYLGMFTHKGKHSLNANERMAHSTHSCLLCSSLQARRPVTIWWPDWSPPPEVLCHLVNFYRFPAQLHFSIASRLATHKPIVKGTISPSPHTPSNCSSTVLVFSRVIKSTVYRCLSCKMPFLSLPPQNDQSQSWPPPCVGTSPDPPVPTGEDARLSSHLTQGFRQVLFSPLNSTYLHKIPPAACHLENPPQHLCWELPRKLTNCLVCLCFSFVSA